MMSLPLILTAGLLACTPELSKDPAGGDTATLADSGSGEPGVTCRGDALTEEVPYSADLSALTARWNTNKELLRGLFIGSPT